MGYRVFSKTTTDDHRVDLKPATVLRDDEKYVFEIVMMQ